MLFYAVISITSALVFYTIGVWSEKLQEVFFNLTLYIRHDCWYD